MNALAVNHIIDQLEVEESRNNIKNTLLIERSKTDNEEKKAEIDFLLKRF
ncbi:MAG: hypothetical protein KA369_08520 [Spirochaetes bacterium]|nr:hypothetical protein [Spirochaetota bacterium]